MPQVTAWHCPKTNKLFLQKEDYQKHIRKVAREERAVKRAAALREEIDQKFIAFRASLTDIRDLAKYVYDNQRFLYEFGQPRWASDRKDRKKIEKLGCWPELIDIQFDLRYSDLVSNTHCAPIGKKTNWGGRDKDLPRGYPGYRGSVVWHAAIDGALYRKKRIDNSVVGDIFDERRSGIYVGTGGGGGEQTDANGRTIIRYRYSCEIFLDDWPGLKEQRHRDQFMSKLKGERLPDSFPNIEWNEKLEEQWVAEQ